LKYKIIYTLSYKKDLPNDIMKSLKSLNRYINKENILVYYTPPINKEFTSKMEKYANIIYSYNSTDEFYFMKNRGFIRAGEKIKLCDVDCKNVIFLDCDTIIKKDISLLLNEEYDFRGRIEELAQSKFNARKWDALFLNRNLHPIPMFNTGFMIFKNNTHKKIKDNWVKYLNSDIKSVHPFSLQKEQYALALALSGYNIKYMSNREHAFRWYDEELIDTYVLHGTKYRTKNIRHFLRNIRRLLI